MVRRRAVAALGCRSTAGAGGGVQGLDHGALQGLETPALRGREVVRKYESGELFERVTAVRQGLFENDGARGPTALSVGVRSDNLEGILE